MAVERTLSIIKPDAVAKNVIGEIYTRFERADLKIIAARMMQLSRADAEGFYAVHKERPFFKDLVDFMTSGPVMIQVLEGEERDPEEPRSDGRHRSEESGQGHDSRRLRSKHRRERGARLRFRRERRRRNRILLSESGHLHALGLRATHGQPSRPHALRTASLLHGAWREAVSREAVDALDSPRRSGRLRRDDRRIESVARRGSREAATIEAPAVRRDTTRRRRHAQMAARRRARATRSKPCSFRRLRAARCASRRRPGCALECSFCSTGRQGFNRNLTVAEIIGQLWLANRALSPGAGTERPITNVVMMGMGEPLANFDNVVAAMQLMLDDGAYGLSRRRVTLSTSGLVPAIDRLRDACPVALAVSLHAPNDALRDELVPINRKYPIRELLAACVRYVEKAPRDFVMFEYVMLDGVNDSVAHARELTRVVADVPCKLNLIPFNPFPNSGYGRSPTEAIERFRDVLVKANITTTRRKTRGDDIDAACGQLAGRVQDRTRRAARRESRSSGGQARSRVVKSWRVLEMRAALAVCTVVAALSGCGSTATAVVTVPLPRRRRRPVHSRHRPRIRSRPRAPAPVRTPSLRPATSSSATWLSRSTK